MELQRISGVAPITPAPYERGAGAPAQPPTPAEASQPGAAAGQPARGSDPAVQLGARYAQFEVDRETGVVRVKVIDAASGEVVRVIPPEELVGMERHLQRLVEAYRQAQLGGSSAPSDR
jgi:hypothetical protein